MICPREPDPRLPLSPEWGAKLVAHVRSLELKTSNGLKVRRGPGGTTLSLTERASPPAAMQQAATTPTFPLQMIDASVLTGTPTANITINYGTVNALTPTISGTPIGTPGPLLNLTSAGTWRVYLDDVVNSSCVVGSVIGAQPADTASHGFKTLGEVDVIASGSGFIVSAIRMATVSSLNHVNCGSSNHNWTQA